MKEKWRIIPGYPEHEASNYGRIRKSSTHRVIKGSISSNGYHLICIKRPVRVHRLIAFAWIKNPLGKPDINHIDGNKLNNRIENLEWCTPAENNLHAQRNGLNKLSPRALRVLAARSSRPVIVFDFIKGKETEYPSLVKFARKSGYHYMSIGSCRRRSALLDCRYIIMSKSKIES